MIDSKSASKINMNNDDDTLLNSYRTNNCPDHQRLRLQGPDLQVSETKKIPNPFFLFFTEIRPKVKKENPNMSSREVTSIISKLWKEMSHTEKNYWCEKYSRLKHEDEKNRMITQLMTLHKRESNSYAIISLKKPNGNIISVPAIVQFLTNNCF